MIGGVRERRRCRERRPRAKRRCWWKVGSRDIPVGRKDAGEELAVELRTGLETRIDGGEEQLVV